MKKDKKAKAIKLRREGKTYSEILKQVPVAKSTLSVWLRNVGLSKPQKQRITRLRRKAQQKGALSRRNQRLKRTENIKRIAKEETGDISRRELWLLGITLYWAEGAKQKENGTRQVSERVQFANSDSRMIEIFMMWLRNVLEVDEERLRYGIYIHENNTHREKEVVAYWARVLGVPTKKLDYIYYKKHNVITTRRDINRRYFGVLKVSVCSSTDLNRKIAGWVEGVYNGLV